MVESDTPAADREGLSASLLNGAMVVLLGCAFPVFLAWTTLAGHPDWSNEAASLPPEPRGSWSENAWLLTLSAFLVWQGVKFLRKTLALRRTRPN